MPPKPKLYTAIIDGEEKTLSKGGWADELGFTIMAVIRHLRAADDDMQVAISTIGAKRPTLGRRPRRINQCQT